MASSGLNPCAKQAYMGSLHGGMKGAHAGAASGIINGVLAANGIPVNINVSYDNETGWGGSIGVNIPIGGMTGTNVPTGGGKSGFSLGGSINFQEGHGMTGGGINIGYKGNGEGMDPAWGGGVGMNFDSYGNFTGGNIEGHYGDDNDRVGAGIRIGADGKYEGYDINVDYTGDITSTGGTLGFNRDGSVDINTRWGVTHIWDTTGEYRFYGVQANNSNSLTIDGGRIVDSSSSVTTTLLGRTFEESKKLLERNQAITAAAYEAETDPVKKAAL